MIRALNQRRVDYLLIGGYALFAHGYHRATTDIDLLVPATREAGECIREVLLVLPDKVVSTSNSSGLGVGTIAGRNKVYDRVSAAVD